MFRPYHRLLGSLGGQPQIPHCVRDGTACVSSIGADYRQFGSNPPGTPFVQFHRAKGTNRKNAKNSRTFLQVNSLERRTLGSWHRNWRRLIRAIRQGCGRSVPAPYPPPLDLAIFWRDYLRNIFIINNIVNCTIYRSVNINPQKQAIFHRKQVVLAQKWPQNRVFYVVFGLEAALCGGRNACFAWKAIFFSFRVGVEAEKLLKDFVG